MRPICDATLNFRSTLSAPLPLIPPPSSFLADAAGIPAPSSSGRHVDEPGPASFCKKISWFPDDDLPFLRMRFFGHQPYLGVSYSKMKTSSLEAHPHVGGLLDWSPHFMWRSSSRNRLQFLCGFHYIKPHRDTKQKPFNRFSVAVTHDAAGRHLIARLLETLVMVCCRKTDREPSRNQNVVRYFILYERIWIKNTFYLQSVLKLQFAAGSCETLSPAVCLALLAFSSVSSISC